MDPVYCAHCIINMDYDQRVPKPSYKNNLDQIIVPQSFDDLIDKIAEYGNRFELWGLKYGGYAITLVNGTSLCKGHAIIELSKVMVNHA